jgi:predicted ATP-grasp superfamily ATP-dependent carboligase
MCKVLVVNAKSAPALAVIRSLGRKSIDIIGASNSSDDFPLYSKYCKSKIILRTDEKDTAKRISELLDIVKKHRPDVFLPIMSESILRVLSRNKAEFENYTRLFVPSYEQFTALSNKAELIRHMLSVDIPTPKTFFIENDASLEIAKINAAFPVVIKPYIGEGAVGIRFVDHPVDLYPQYQETVKLFGPCFVQEFINGSKYSAIYLFNGNAEPRRFFVHRAIREYPITGGPTCYLESVKYDPIFEYGQKLLKAVDFYGLVDMEFIVDRNDGKPKIIDANPRFYGPIQCAISAGVDLPFDIFRMAMEGDIETDFTYQEGIRCRHLLFDDIKYLISVFRGGKSLKYDTRKIPVLLDFLKFKRDDSYFVVSRSDPMPALKKILRFI